MQERAHERLPSLDPALDRFDERVRQHLRHRRAWHDRVLERTGLTGAQRADVHGELAMLYHAYELGDAARELYEEAARQAPDEARWFHYLGHLHRSNNELEQSVAAFRRTIELDATLLAARIRLAEVLMDLERTEEAFEELRSLLSQDPDLAVVHFHLGTLYAARQQPQLAVEHLSRCLELQPEADSVRTPLGLAYRDLGREEEARRELEAAGDGAVTMADPLMLRLHALANLFWQDLGAAVTALEEGNRAEAREALSRAIAADGLAPEPRFLLGQLLLEAGEPVQGRRQLELTVFLSDKAAPAHFLLAQEARRRGDLAGTIDELRLAVTDDPETGAFRYQLGEALLAASRYDEAIAELRRAQDLMAGESTMPLILEATAYIASDRCGLAVRRVTEGLASSPEQGLLRHALARLLAACPRAEHRQGDRALAIASDLFERAPTPGHAQALSMAMAETGDIAGAARRLRRTVAETEARGQHALADLLRRDLEPLESGVPVREPWRRDELVLFRVGGPPG